MPKQGFILCSTGTQALDRLARDHQHMHRRLGGDIPEREALLIAVHLIAGDLTTQDLPEDRVIRHGPRSQGNNGAGATAGA